MKKIVSVLTLCISCILAMNCYSDTTSIQDAVNKNLVSCTARSLGGARGQCILFSIANKTAEDILVHLEAGRFMMPSDTTRQRMIITKDRFITLHKNTTDTVKSYAMCTQMQNAAPLWDMVFKIGNMAEGELLELVQIISENNFQTMTAQSAVWAITDKNDITDVYSNDIDQMQLLRETLAKLKARDQYNFITSYTGFLKIRNGISDSTFLNYKPDKVEGAIQFDLTEDTKMSLVLYTEKGEIAKTCFRNRQYNAGLITITYDFSYYTVPKGNYHLKLFDGNNNVLLDKFMTFKTSVFSF